MVKWHKPKRPKILFERGNWFKVDARGTLKKLKKAPKNKLAVEIAKRNPGAAIYGDVKYDPAVHSHLKKYI